MPHKGLTMLEINADIPQETVKAFEDAFTRYQTDLGNSQATAVRRGVVAFITKVRSRTLKAKEKIPAKAVTRYDGDGPKYITPKGKRQEPQPRWTVRRRDQSKSNTYVKHAKGITTATAAREKFGKIRRWGLARTSWGLFMTHLFGRANPEGKNPEAKVRDGLTSGYLREYVTGSNPRVEALLVNSLGYITEATSDAALSEAMQKATNQINGYINNRLKEGLK